VTISPADGPPGRVCRYEWGRWIYATDVFSDAIIDLGPGLDGVFADAKDNPNNMLRSEMGKAKKVNWECSFSPSMGSYRLQGPVLSLCTNLT